MSKKYPEFKIAKHALCLKPDFFILFFNCLFPCIFFNIYLSARMKASCWAS